jgi:hypothetical protein
MSLRLGLVFIAIAALQSACASASPGGDAAMQARDARRAAALQECEKQKGNETYVNCKRAANQLE